MMTITDIGTMLQLLEANYGSGMYKDTNRENVLNLWTVMFEDDDPKEVAYAVKDCIATLQPNCSEPHGGPNDRNGGLGCHPQSR